MIRSVSILLALLGSGPAHAHAFESGQDAYELLLQGISQPWLMLPVAVLLLGLGMLTGIWRTEGVIVVWPAMIAGALLGLGLGPFIPQVEVIWLMGLALAISIVGIIALPLPSLAMTGLAALATLLPSRFLLETHAFGELPLPFLIGMGIGITTCAALAAGVVQATREQIGHVAVLIGWRALISWIGAISILMLAFELRPV